MGFHELRKPTLSAAKINTLTYSIRSIAAGSLPLAVRARNLFDDGLWQGLMNTARFVCDRSKAVISEVVRERPIYAGKRILNIR